MNSQTESWVDDALTALGTDDAQAIVPARVGRAVMRAWDGRLPVSSHVPLDRGARVRFGALVVAVAALVVVAVVLRRDPLPAAAGAAGTREFGYVLVPDPMADPASLQVVRLRMPRAGLANLGVPLANPDADGLVDVELLVGEDGVARAIGRATLVTTTEISGGRPQ